MVEDRQLEMEIAEDRHSWQVEMVVAVQVEVMGQLYPRLDLTSGSQQRQPQGQWRRTVRNLCR